METTERAKRLQRFLVENKKFFPPSRMSDIKDKMSKLSDDQFEQVEWLEFKDPLTMTIIAVFLGGLGVDRFMLGDSKNGMFKLLACILIIGWIWWFIDIFSIGERTTNFNYKLFVDSISLM